MRSIASPTRVAVLGGGVAALSAAYELSHPRQQGLFKVTVYQLGWRLGGKCASGRDLDQAMRIKEHGPHLLFGFYDNGFEMMDECYAALQRPVDHPFRTFEDALIGSNNCCVMEKPEGVWMPWQLPIVALNGKPGAEGAFSRWEIALNAIDRLAYHTRSSDVIFPGEYREMDESEAEQAAHSFEALLNTYCDRRLAAGAKDFLAGFTTKDAGDRGFMVRESAMMLMKASAASALSRARKIEISQNQVPHKDALALASDLRCTQQVIQFAAKNFSPLDDVARRWIILADLGATVLLGATLDELLMPTRESLLAANRYEYRDWLRNFNALEMTIDSAIVRAMYDTVFGYVGGDPESGGNVEAGSVVRAQLDMVSSRGNLFWKMRAGTGDVVAAPLYQRLKHQGVDFQFFRQVEDLVPSSDGRSVAEIHFIRQAEVLHQPYCPLRECKGIPVWPDRPDLDQLENGRAYVGVDFESYWAPENPNRLVRKAGDDFDAIVLGIGLGALSPICDRLRQVNGDWEAMLANGKTVATQSLQLWMHQATSASGWSGPPDPEVTSFDATAMDTWLDASHVIEFENWNSAAPVQMAMICGPFPGQEEIPDQNQADYPATSMQEVQQNVGKFFDTCSALWPNFCSNGTFDQGRLRADFVQPGINPSDRYVQTPRDSSRFRLAPDRSGFSNMVLAGDWTDYGLNLGCFEGAVISGRLAANALGGQPRRILREEPHGSSGRTAASGGPQYVEHHPPLTLGGPIVFPDVTMWAFFLRGQIGTLTTLCQRFFDVPTGGRVTFAPLTQTVIMTISELAHGYFQDAPGHGQSTEREVAFGIPGTYACRDEAGKLTATGLATFMPYLFVDNPVALTTGREVLGYFKQLGEVGLPGPGGRENFFLNVLGAKQMAAGVEWGEQRLLTVAGRDPQVLRPRQAKQYTKTTDVADDRPTLMSKLQALVKSVMCSPIPGNAILATGDFCGLLSGSASQLFLKQFRAAGDGNAAAYQAVTMAEYNVTGIHSIRPTQSFGITIHPLESLPIATELGVNPDMVETGVEVNFEMTLGSGRVLWQA
jgi:uncharacterized protein with NAD-binding domain and iron-sulfur cluster